jgi:hypothetical protein
MAILQFLRIGTALEVFLERVLADMAGADGRDGRFVDDGFAIVCHGFFFFLD